MDKREMKRLLKLTLFRELWQNETNQFGETRQEIVLSKMNIYDPSEATKRRFNEIIVDIFRVLQEREK